MCARPPTCCVERQASLMKWKQSFGATALKEKHSNVSMHSLIKSRINSRGVFWPKPGSWTRQSWTIQGNYKWKKILIWDVHFAWTACNIGQKCHQMNLRKIINLLYICAGIVPWSEWTKVTEEWCFAIQWKHSETLIAHGDGANFSRKVCEIVRHSDYAQQNHFKSAGHVVKRESGVFLRSGPPLS